MTSTANIMTVGHADKEFIRKFVKLTPDKKALVKGIVILLSEEDRARLLSNAFRAYRCIEKAKKERRPADHERFNSNGI